MQPRLTTRKATSRRKKSEPPWPQPWPGCRPISDWLSSCAIVKASVMPKRQRRSAFRSRPSDRCWRARGERCDENCQGAKKKLPIERHFFAFPVYLVTGRIFQTICQAITGIAARYRANIRFRRHNFVCPVAYFLALILCLFPYAYSLNCQALLRLTPCRSARAVAGLAAQPQRYSARRGSP
jgi:hypothetical protein